jgi:hypothetical protein
MWLYHTKGHIKTIKMAIKKGNIPRWLLVSITVLFSIDTTNQMLKKQGAGYDVKEIKSDNYSIRITWSYFIDMRLSYNMS